MTKRDLIFTGIGGGLTTLTKRTTLGWFNRLRIDISLRILKASVFEMKTSSIRLMATTSCVCWSFDLQTHLCSFYEPAYTSVTVSLSIKILPLNPENLMNLYYNCKVRKNTRKHQLQGHPQAHIEYQAQPISSLSRNTHHPAPETPT
jgi:hypothetical protein